MQLFATSNCKLVKHLHQFIISQYFRIYLQFFLNKCISSSLLHKNIQLKSFRIKFRCILLLEKWHIPMMFELLCLHNSHDVIVGLCCKPDIDFPDISILSKTESIPIAYQYLLKLFLYHNCLQTDQCLYWKSYFETLDSELHSRFCVSITKDGSGFQSYLFCCGFGFR